MFADMCDRSWNLGILARFEKRMGAQHQTQVAERGDRHHQRRVGCDESNSRFHHRLDFALQECANRF